MDKQLFEDLTESVKQAGSIARGDAAPSRSFTVEDRNVEAIAPETADGTLADDDTKVRFKAIAGAANIPAALAVLDRLDGQ